MRLKKQNFQVVFEDVNRFSVKVRKPFLRFFSRWIPLMYQEAEHSEELPVEFKTFEEATSFVDSIAD